MDYELETASSYIQEYIAEENIEARPLYAFFALPTLPCILDCRKRRYVVSLDLKRVYIPL